MLYSQSGNGIGLFASKFKAVETIGVAVWVILNVSNSIPVDFLDIGRDDFEGE